MALKRSLGRVGYFGSVITLLFNFGVIGLLTPGALASQSLTLSWNPSPDTNVVSYNLYYGTSSGVYSYKLCVGDVTSTTVTDLHEGYTYFFVVTAVNCVGLESQPSNEFRYLVPGLSLALMTSFTNGCLTVVHVTALGNPPPQWTLQQSTDLQSWQPVKCGTNCPVDATVDTSTTTRAFFRLVTP